MKTPSMAANDATNVGQTKPYVQKTYSLGAALNFNCDKALATASEIEDEIAVARLMQMDSGSPRP